MGLYLLQRFVLLLATLVFASIVVFGVLEILPGNAAQVMLGASATPETVAALAHKLGLDQGFLVRYLAWIGGAAHGDFGLSYAYDSPIGALIAQRLAVSAPLALIAMLITTIVALTAGVFASQRRGKSGDVVVMAASQIGLAVPNFWFAILLVLVFAVHWHIAPSGGFPGWEAGLRPALGALILPALALGLVQAAILTRVTLWRHALPNALTPILTIMGLQFANLIAGAIIVESVFTLPGIGRLIFQSIANRDLLVVEDCVMLLAAIVIGVNFLVDIACAAIDPRLRRRVS
jgi:peptide/nickel transport system permease protein